MGLDEVRADWTRLGSSEPLWAVCVDPAKRGGGWGDDEFLASGAAEIDAALGRLTDLGLDPGQHRALDFGCGAGRLSNALAGHFAEVVGVDISEPMLAEARRLDRSGGRIGFRINDTPDLGAFGDGSFDLVYTDLVLQHLPPALAEGYVREFVRVLRPGGAMVIGVPDRERPTAKGLVFRFAPWPLIRLAQRRLLGYPAPMRMHPLPRRRLAAVLAEGGARIAASDAYWGGGHWRHLRHYVRLPAGEAP
ncbi:class I SAM-dependent methyltransferase [Streptomonospora salina]|uniref:SAM-dependent methyltransferase n=1 Tax=Streptomonospora salina TaxID=104205 RepID=A0A841E583_9ACTN|nr:methyltransferase domain-containing protein [Streptomonospora salina]MBB5997614.1 SAM-dependent methyltransferase [Streptomonospora salina]